MTDDFKRQPANDVQQSEGSGIGDQRDNTRYACQGSVEFWIEGSQVRTFAKAVDLSFGGCYVEMTATSAIGVKLNLIIEIDDRRFQAKGVVKTSYPCLGMGIEFTEVSLDDRARLSEILLRMSGHSHSPEQETSGQPHRSIAFPENVDAATALIAIAKFFESRNSLTRDEFLLHVARSVTKH